MAKLLLSAFTDEYADSLAEQIEGMKRFSLGYTELRFVDKLNVSQCSLSQGKELQSRLQAEGLRVSAIGSPLGKIPLDSDRSAHRETAKRIFELAALLETEYVRVFSFYAPHDKAVTLCKNQVVDALGELIELARPYGLTLCHENEAKIYGDLPHRCRELLDVFGGELKCVFDMGNFVLEGQDPYPEAYELLKEYIAYFHIKDALFEGAIVPPGKGNAKIREILTAHKAYAKKDFFVSLEPHLQTFSGRNALVGRAFDNPYKFPDQKSAFAAAVQCFREGME